MNTVLNSAWTLLIHITGKTRIDSVSPKGRQLVLTYWLSAQLEQAWVEVEKKWVVGDIGDSLEQIMKGI